MQRSTSANWFQTMTTPVRSRSKNNAILPLPLFFTYFLFLSFSLGLVSIRFRLSRNFDMPDEPGRTAPLFFSRSLFLPFI